MAMAQFHTVGEGGEPTYASSSENLTSAKNIRSPKNASRRKLFIWIGVAALAVLVAVGVTLGVLASQGVLSTDSSAELSSSTTAPGDDRDSNKDSDNDDSDSQSPPGASTTKEDKPSSTSASASSSSSSETEATACPTEKEIPSDDRGTILDTTSWFDLTDFNCTFTDERVGDLPLVGLNASWDDSAQANEHVPALNKPWGSYTSRPLRGVNVGGWLSLEPFITPSLFDYPADAEVVDEWSLCKHLGDKAAETLEKHYATFITEEDFKNIAAAGLDHVRVPFSYWAVETFDDDPYVPGISWRYLLRGIEWARKYGLRIKLDLHGLPGSQNGWNHSGRIGQINFLKGPNGDKNAKRALDIHDRLSKFFAQDRYKNVVAFYGLANEPASSLDQDRVEKWTREATDLIRKNGITAAPVFSEGMKGLSFWSGKFSEYKDARLTVDAHHYTIFDLFLISLKHNERIEFGCASLGDESVHSMEGFGPTMVGEWSQAHNDCTEHLNGVGSGNRWTGTFYGVESPSCPTQDKQCSCDYSNDASKYSDEYKLFIKTWAIAQMDAYEKAWGWFYWTWKTESAPLWSYKHGLDGGFMPKKAYERGWDCSKPIPDFGDLPEYI